MPHLNTPHHKGRHPHGNEPLMVGGKVGGPFNANIDTWALFDTKKREDEPMVISNQINLTAIKKKLFVGQSIYWPSSGGRSDQ